MCILSAKIHKLNNVTFKNLFFLIQPNILVYIESSLCQWGQDWVAVMSVGSDNKAEIVPQNSLRLLGSTDS